MVLCDLPQQNKGKDKRSINLSVFLNSLLADNHHLQVGSNYLYIHKIDGKTFLFTKTNDKSLVQKINRSKASVEDIKNSLADDESLGFPSFCLLKATPLVLPELFSGRPHPI